MESKMHSLGYLLDRALYAMSNTLKNNLRQHGIDLPHSQYLVMRLLFEQDGISQAKIAAELHKDTAAIKRSIDNLENKKLVTRASASRCKYNIFLTDEGKRLKPQIIDIYNKTMKEILSDISPETYRVALQFLTDIYQSSTKNTQEPH